MASDRPSQPGVPEMDEFEAMWAEHVEKDPNICEANDIDPSKPGWEIILHLFDEDPEKGEEQLVKDMTLLRSLESVGILTVKYIPKKGDNRIILNHKEESPLEHFIRDYRELFNRYNPLIKAPMSARREASTKDDAIANVSLRSQEEAWKILEETKPQSTLQKPVKKKESGRQKIEAFQFDSIITTIPFDHPHQERIRASLQWACEAEDLEYEEEEDTDTNHYDITMSKKEGVVYSDMKQNNVLAIYNLHVLHKLALTLF